MLEQKNVTVKAGSSFQTICPFPVGYIYQSYNSTSPANIYGGSWTPITGRFLYCNNGTSTGGANSKTYNFNHNHAMTLNKKNSTGSWSYKTGQSGIGFHDGDAAVQNSPVLTSTSVAVASMIGCNGPASVEGGNTPKPLDDKTIDTMPAYQTCYAWRRTA